MHVPFCTPVLLAAVPFSGLWGQYTGYWTNTYGSLSALRGGVVVASVADNSALFYNPAALASATQSQLSVQATAYRLSWLDVPSGAGQNLDLTNLGLGYYPQMMSALKRYRGLDRHTFSAGVLARNNGRVRVQSRFEGRSTDYYPDLDGPEDLTAQLDFEDTYQEVWAGLGYAYALSDRWSLGSTLFLAYRSNRIDNEVYSTILPSVTTPNTYSTVTTQFDLNLTHFRSLLKLGAWGRVSRRWAMGACFTTPSLSVFGIGEAHVNQTLTNPDLRSPGFADIDFNVNSLQKNKRMTYRSPASLALGASYTGRNGWQLDLVGEWFAQLKAYVVFDPDPDANLLQPADLNSLIDLDTDDVMSLGAQEGAILNLGISGLHPVADSLKLAWSLRTDLTGRTRALNTSFVLRQSAFQQLRTTLGILWKRARQDVAVGLDYGVGVSGIRPDFDISNPRYGIPGEKSGLAPEAIAWQHHLTLVLGYTHFIR